MFVAANASAQQRPQPINTTQTDGTTTAGTTQQTLPPIHFPAPAATYERYVKFFIDMLHKPNKLHLTPGDTDKVILAFRDCAMHAEGDGYVTAAEYNYCRNIYQTKLREAATPYITQAAATAGH